MHAKLAPSAAHRWLNCPGSVALSEGIERTSSIYADEGTRAHEYAATILDNPDYSLAYPIEDEEMISYINVYVAAVQQAAEGKLLLVEAPVDISMWTGEQGGKGIADAVIYGDGVLEIHDLKYGMGYLMGHLVDAEHNEQLMIYALGVLDLVETFGGEVKEVKLVIHQPRRDHLSEWTVSRAELLSFGVRVKDSAAYALECKSGEGLHPSDKACLWCPAKATCPALARLVHDEIFNDFDEVKLKAGEIVETNQLPSPSTLNLIEQWTEAVRDLIFFRLQNFEPVPGWKLVKGREGNRKWADEALVETLLKHLKVTKGNSHELKLKSPAQLEKLSLAPKKWAAIETHITRNEAKPVVVAESDPRPAIEQASKSEFEIFS